MTTEAVNWLHYSLPKRETPEAVAERVCDALGAAAPSEARRIARAGTKQRFGWSSMSNRFRGADPMDRQIAKARELAQAFLDRDLPGADDIARPCENGRTGGRLLSATGLFGRFVSPAPPASP